MLEDNDAVELSTELYVESASSSSSSRATSWSAQCWAGRIPAGVCGTVGLWLLGGLFGGGVVTAFGDAVSPAVGEEGDPCLVGSPLMVGGGGCEQDYDYSGNGNLL